MIQVDKYLWRGPRPKNMKALWDVGFKEVIDLASGFYEKAHNDEYEDDKRIKRYPIKLHDFNLSNIFPPRHQLVDIIIQAMPLSKEV